MREALRIVEPVDTDHHGTAGQALDDVAHQLRPHRLSRQAAEFAGFDAYREGADAYRSLGGLKGIAAAFLQSAFIVQITRAIGGIVFGLQAHEVIGGQLRDQPFVVGQSSENIGRWKRDGRAAFWRAG